MWPYFGYSAFWEEGASSEESRKAALKGSSAQQRPLPPLSSAVSLICGFRLQSKFFEVFGLCWRTFLRMLKGKIGCVTKDFLGQQPLHESQEAALLCLLLLISLSRSVRGSAGAGWGFVVVFLFFFFESNSPHSVKFPFQ